MALVDVLRVMGGRVVKHWGELDLAGLEQQLAVPDSATAGVTAR